MLKTLLLLFCAVLAAVPATAQEAATPLRRTVVTFTLSARLSGASSAGAQVPVVIVERAAADPRLASLTVEQTETRADPALRIRFVFDNEAEFRRWYEAEPTRAFFALVRQSGGTPSYSLDVKRYPLAQLMRAADQR